MNEGDRLMRSALAAYIAEQVPDGFDLGPEVMPRLTKMQVGPLPARQQARSPDASFWFGGGVRALVSDDVWALLVSQGRFRRYGTGDVIVRQGQAVRRVIVLLDGRVKVTRSEADGTEILLAIRGAGEIMGEMALLDGGVASGTVTALRECWTRVLSADAFTEFVSRHDLALPLLRLAMARRRESEQNRIELATLPVTQRLVRTLLQLMDAIGTPAESGLAVDLGMPQEELARVIGASRSQLAATLGSLRKRGVLSTGRRRVVIRDIEGLRMLDAQGQYSKADLFESDSSSVEDQFESATDTFSDRMWK